jgi:nitrogen regulatory protein P-II 2
VYFLQPPTHFALSSISGEIIDDPEWGDSPPVSHGSHGFSSGFPWHSFCTVVAAPLMEASEEYAHRGGHRIPDYRTVYQEMHSMKMITAVVRPFKLDELRQAIAQLGVQGVTVTEVYEAQFGPRAKVEIAVDDGIVEPVLEAIANVSRTGRAGDGRIFVGELEQTIRIRTGETGTAAT